MIRLTIFYIPLSAFAYRIGGMSKTQAAAYFPWFPKVLVKGCFRDIICSALQVLWVWAFLPRVVWYLYIASFVFMWIATTTYWDDFPPQKGKDKFWMHSLGISLALLPIAYPVLLGWLIRTIIMSGLMYIWCEKFLNDNIEEYGRGTFLQVTLPLLLLGK